MINSLVSDMRDDKFTRAIKAFDQANEADPNRLEWNGKIWPKELLYAHRMSGTLSLFKPEASDALRLATRCQHICRWEIPRHSFPMDKKGYYAWRNKLKSYHAEKAANILKKMGYDNSTIEAVQVLVTKKKMKTNPDSQILEDVVCMVFLQYYLDEFASDHDEEKVLEILRKTWKKISPEGRQKVLELPLSAKTKSLISKALPIVTDTM